MVLLGLFLFLDHQVSIYGIPHVYRLRGYNAVEADL